MPRNKVSSENSWPLGFSLNVVKDAPRSGALSSFVIALEAWRRGLTVTLLDDKLNNIRITDGIESVIFNHSCPISQTPKTVRATVRNKANTKEKLKAAGVPVPDGELLNLQDISHRRLIEAARNIGYPVAIKPVDGSKGEGVYTNIRSDEELLRTYDHFIETNQEQELVIEEHFNGDDYRALVLDNEVLAFTRRVPANVVGDGHSTIAELIDAKNDKRNENPFLRSGPIKVDFEVEERLKSRGFTLLTVPPTGSRVTLHHVANASAGGDLQDYTDRIPREIEDAVIASVKAVPKMSIAGVDILYRASTDGSPPSFTVIEMNYRPHIALSMYPDKGHGPDVPRAVIDHFFPDSSRDNTPNSHRVAFDYIRARKPLRENVAKSVTLAPPPEEGFETARVATYPPSGITPHIRGLVAGASRKYGISGSVSSNDIRLRFVVAGNRENLVDFLEATKIILGTPPLSTGAWRGRILHGFRFYGLS